MVPKAHKELGDNSLQSPDDWEATIQEVGSGLRKGYVAKFVVEICEACPFLQARKCPTRYRKRQQFFSLYFMKSNMRGTLRRPRNRVFQQSKHNPRAAIEATVRTVKLPLPKGKLSARGRFRMFYMMIGSAAITNVRQIQRHLVSKLRTYPRILSVFLAGDFFGGFNSLIDYAYIIKTLVLSVVSSL